MNRLSLILVFLLMICVFNPVQGAQFLGGNGYIHTNSAQIVPAGATLLDGFIRMYGVTDNQENLSDVSMALALSYGFSKHLELGFSQTLYQDLNYTDVESSNESIMIPGNYNLKLKMGNYRLGDNYYWGGLGLIRYRVAKWQDLQFEPYTSDAIEAEFQLMGTYYDKPLMPDQGVAVNANLGFIYHNDGSTEDEGDAISANFVLSFMMPFENMSFDFGVEAYGSFFISRPTLKYLAREDWVYLTPMIRTKQFGPMRYYIGLDLLVLGSDDTSEPAYGAEIRSFPNYATWRLSFRANYTVPFNTILSGGGSVIGTPTVGHAASQTQAGSRQATPTYLPANRQSMFRWGFDDQSGQVNAVDLDLERIRMERKNAEKELERLKMKMNEKKR